MMKTVDSKSIKLKRALVGTVAAGAVLTGAGVGAGLASADAPAQHHNQSQQGPQQNQQHNQARPQQNNNHHRQQPQPQHRQNSPRGFWLFGFWIPLP